jgi:hypothetical protein
MLPSKTIISFYSGKLKNSSRKLEDIWKFNDDELEGYHTYIQWLFPLEVPSAVNFAAPVLDDDVISEFRNSPALKENLLRSFKMMLKFYGFEAVETGDDVEIQKSSDYGIRKENWISHRNHNYLRITRILTSTRLLGLEKYSKAFFTCLEKVYAEEAYEIGEETFAYWKNTQTPAR